MSSSGKNGYNIQRQYHKAHMTVWIGLNLIQCRVLQCTTTTATEAIILRRNMDSSNRYAIAAISVLRFLFFMKIMLWNCEPSAQVPSAQCRSRILIVSKNSKKRVMSGKCSKKDRTKEKQKLVVCSVFYPPVLATRGFNCCGPLNPSSITKNKRRHNKRQPTPLFYWTSLPLSHCSCDSCKVVSHFEYAFFIILCGIKPSILHFNSQKKFPTNSGLFVRPSLL